MPPSPAFSESELREHLDLLSTVVTSVSDRLDTQATTLNTLVEAAASARQAAFAARAQTDPQAYGAEVVKTVQASLAEVSQRFDKLAAIHADLQAERLAATQWRRRVPGIYGTAALLAIVLPLCLLLAAGQSETACALVPGKWVTNTATGEARCVLHKIPF